MMYNISELLKRPWTMLDHSILNLKHFHLTSVQNRTLLTHLKNQTNTFLI